MGTILGWARGHKTLASVVVIAIIAGVPVAFAAVHQGFPVTDVTLNSRDVWVTNSGTGQAGRLNRQVNQLNGQVVADSASFDVLENGADLDAVFLQDKAGSTLKYIDPEVTTTAKVGIKVPAGAGISYGKSTISVLAADGRLWAIAASANTSFEYKTQHPALTGLGSGAQAVVGQDGTTWVVSPASRKLYSIKTDGSRGPVVTLPALSKFELSTVGSTAVILDIPHHRLITSDGTELAVPSTSAEVRLQLPSAASDYALVATPDSLVRVSLDGNKPDTVPANIPHPGGRIAAPVQLQGCDNGAWSGTGRYLYACGATVRPYSIKGGVGGDELRFRVNGTVIALNDVVNGNAWLSGSKDLIPVSNWKDVTPPKDETATQEENKTTVQSFTDAPLPDWGDNHPPIAVDDAFGVRAADPSAGGVGVTTTLPVLDNDSDPDGDVLTVSSVGAVPAAFGTTQLVDGGRAIQFSSAAGATGSFSFGYSASDGRPGGIADASVTITIHAFNDPGSKPVAKRSSALVVEAGRSASYNVLSDWIDPDGDAIRLADATVASGDSVRFTPDGLLTFQSKTAQVGVQQVNFTVVDSSTAKLEAQGSLSVDVQAPGGKPVPIQDFATGFAGDTIIVSPLLNDRSPSGAPLSLLSLTALNGGSPPVPNLEAGTVEFTEPVAGTYYANYIVGAGATSATGRIRVDVIQKPSGHLAPIAVSDVAYLIGTDPITIPVLDNDISPSGDVLGVQSIEVRSANPQFKVEILNSTELRVTAPSPLESQATISYTISDGTSSATADVTIVPVPVLQKHQAPIAVDDLATVRAGSVVTVPVLANDVDPDGATLSVDPILAQAPAAGFAFVSGNTIRFQAPDKAGQYTATYTAVDSAQESATANVTFTVVATDAKNHAPLPVPVTARVFTGGTVHIAVPVDGIDPDGDSVSLSDPGDPTNGTISANFGTASFDYKAGSVAGTDSFDYVVVDAQGATGIAKVRIGVIPRPPAVPPVAINDSLEMRPSADATVDVTANDSNPNGNAISVERNVTIQPATGITAKLVANQLVVTSSAVEGKYSVTYTIVDGLKSSLSATAILSVVVSKTAPLHPPTAIDHVLTKKAVAGGTTVSVDSLEGAHDPAGLVSALRLSLQPGQKNATTAADGTTVRVTPTKAAQAIAYTLTSKSGLSSSAFIMVPAIPPKGWDQLPYIKKNLPDSVTTVERNSQKQWQLADIVTAPSGTAVKLEAKNPPTATHSAGGKLTPGPTQLQFTPVTGYTGRALISFRVTDAQGHAATLVFHISVGSKDLSDVPPTFTTAKVNVPAGGSVPMNLQDSTLSSSAVQLGQIRYSADAGTGGGGLVKGSMQGSSLKLSADDTAKPGTTVTFAVTLAVGKFSNIRGKVIATVVSTLKPLPQAVTDTLHAKRGGGSVSVHPLDNDVNPYPASQPLVLVGNPTIETANTSATATRSGDSTIIITPGPSYIGDLSVTYQVQDHSGDPTRIVTGRIVVTVWDVPDQMAAPAIVSKSDSTVTIQFQPPPSINGSPVDHYTVRSVPASTSPSCQAGADCVFSGLTNGQSYTFYATSTNAVGTSAESSASDPVAPYAIPSSPTFAHLSPATAISPANLTMSWGAPSSDGGGGVFYNWSFAPTYSAQKDKVSGTSDSVSGVPNGTYSYTVAACNTAGCSSAVTSNQAVVSSPPPPPAANMTISQPTPGDHWIHLVIEGYAANTKYTISCWVTPQSDGQNGHSIGSFDITTDGSGGGTWDNPSTCSMTGGGYGNLRSTIVWSNTILLN